MPTTKQEITRGTVRIRQKEGGFIDAQYIAYLDPKRLERLVAKARNNKTKASTVGGTTVTAAGTYTWDAGDVRWAAFDAFHNKSKRSGCGALEVRIIASVGPCTVGGK
jgi:hypothetical protein